LVGTDYTGHFNSDRTGVRHGGAEAQWARSDGGGGGGLHPSNIHDNAYCVGTLDFTGDTPILLGPDGPSLGGFVCPVTVVGGDRVEAGVRWRQGRGCGSFLYAPTGRRRCGPLTSTDARRCPW